LGVIIASDQRSRSSYGGLVPEEIGDHVERQRRGEIPDEVAAAVLTHPVDDLPAQLPHEGLVGRDPPGREAAGDERPAALVLGIVH
jgi:hypothetical protein